MVCVLVCSRTTEAEETDRAAWGMVHAWVMGPHSFCIIMVYCIAYALGSMYVVFHMGDLSQDWDFHAVMSLAIEFLIRICSRPLGVTIFNYRIAQYYIVWLLKRLNLSDHIPYGYDF